MATLDGSPITVLLADTSDVAGVGLKALLVDDPRFTIVGETAGAVVALARRLRPDLVVLDPQAGYCLDVQCITDLVAVTPDSRIFVYTSVFTGRSYRDAMLAGALAYFLKGSAHSELLRESLFLVGRYGAAVTDPAIVAYFKAHPEDQRIFRAPEPPAQSPTLTAEQRVVLNRVAEGLTRDKIAEAENLSRRTVDRAMTRLFEQFGVSSSTEVVAEAARLGLIPPRRLT